MLNLAAWHKNNVAKIEIKTINNSTKFQALFFFFLAEERKKEEMHLPVSTGFLIRCFTTKVYSQVPVPQR